jgi:hypothetical protein
MGLHGLLQGYLLSEPIEDDHGGGQDPHRILAPVKGKKKKNYNIKYH